MYVKQVSFIRQTFFPSDFQPPFFNPYFSLYTVNYQLMNLIYNFMFEIIFTNSQTKNFKIIGSFFLNPHPSILGQKCIYRWTCPFPLMFNLRNFLLQKKSHTYISHNRVQMYNKLYIFFFLFCGSTSIYS